MQTTHVAEEAAIMSHDSPLPRVHSLGSDEGTHHEGEEGRKIAQLNEDEGITLVQMGTQTQGKHEHDLEPDFEFTTLEEVYTVEPDISIANVPVSIAGVEVSTVSPEVKTAAEKENKVATRAKRLGYEEALRLQEQLNEEERQRISKVHEEANTFNAEEWDNKQAQIEAIKNYSTEVQIIRKFLDPTDDKERALCVELKRLFEPDIDDIMWKLQRYIHDPLT
ncbi:hypothetical protein Tco_1361026 [Tanacetum coccineum]